MRAVPLIRLVWLVLAHLTVHLWHTRRAGRNRRVSIVLSVHIFIGLFETFRFALIDLSIDPLPSLIDILACIIQSGTNAILVSRMNRGFPIFTPASYLSGALLRPLLTLLSYNSHNPLLHRISISTVDGFLWTRIFILLLRFSPVPRLGEYQMRYAVAVFAAGCLGFVKGGQRSQEAIGTGGFDGIGRGRGRTGGRVLGPDTTIWIDLMRSGIRTRTGMGTGKGTGMGLVMGIGVRWMMGYMALTCVLYVVIYLIRFMRIRIQSRANLILKSRTTPLTFTRERQCAERTDNQYETSRSIRDTRYTPNQTPTPALTRCSSDESIDNDDVLLRDMAEVVEVVEVVEVGEKTELSEGIEGDDADVWSTSNITDIQAKERELFRSRTTTVIDEHGLENLKALDVDPLERLQRAIGA